MPENHHESSSSLTQEGLQDLLESVHNHESFGRSLLAGIFSKGIEQAKQAGSQQDEIVVPAQFRLKPAAGGCYRVYSDVCQCYVIACGKVLPD